jgi:hypothetical protein
MEKYKDKVSANKFIKIFFTVYETIKVHAPEDF